MARVGIAFAGWSGASRARPLRVRIASSRMPRLPRHRAARVAAPRLPASTCRGAARAGSARRCSCCATAASRRPRRSRRARASPQFADRAGCVVLLPRQKDARQSVALLELVRARARRDGDGEAAIVAAQIRSVRRALSRRPQRVFVAGMSAGGALAAIARRALSRRSSRGRACTRASPAARRRSALTAHQRDAARARDQTSRRSAAKRARAGAPRDVPRAAARDPRRRATTSSRRATRAALVRQYLRAQRHPAVAGAGRASTLPRADARRDVAHARRPHRRPSANGAATAASSRATSTIDGLGHAWSGGDAALAVQRRGARPTRRRSSATSSRDALSCTRLGSEERAMAVSGMNHFTILTDDVPRTVDVLRRPAGPRRRAAARPRLSRRVAVRRRRSRSCTSSAARPRERAASPASSTTWRSPRTGLADDARARSIAHDIEHVCRQQAGTRHVAGVLLRSQRRARRARLRAGETGPARDAAGRRARSPGRRRARRSRRAATGSSELTGVAPQPGGKHVAMGTHNALLRARSALLPRGHRRSIPTARRPRGRAGSTSTSRA